MIFDRTALFSDAQAITATSFSTNVVDLGPTGTPTPGTIPIVRDVGKGTTVPLACRVVENFNNLTSLVVTIEVATDAALTSPVTVFSSPTYSLADVSTAKRYLLPDSIPVGANLRYMRLKYTVTGTAPTTGKITAGVTMGNQTNSTL